MPGGAGSRPLIITTGVDDHQARSDDPFMRLILVSSGANKAGAG